MNITCISDLHGFYPELDGGDLLIIAGDCTANDKTTEWSKFFEWLKKQNYRKKIVIAGNHDNFFLSGFPRTQEEANNFKEVREFLEENEGQEKPDFEYLCDSGIEFEGLKIWGSPWTKNFYGQNPKCKAFGLDTETQLKERFDLIPNDIDILITHSPPKDILDDTGKNRCGSESLRNMVISYERLPNLKLHVFAHIHECGGEIMVISYERLPNLNLHVYGHIQECGGEIIETTLKKFVNASHVNENYEPVNKPVRVII